MNQSKVAVPGDVADLCARLAHDGHASWLVGGCVRDALLGRPVHDWDVATTAHPRQVQDTFRRVIPTGLQHGTVVVRWRGQGYEVTTLRAESGYQDGRRPDAVTFVDDIGVDLGRRDLTINAMAFDPLTNQLVDPFGGRADLAARLVRAVGDPEARFREDGLRILRAARFAATLAFDLEESTQAGMQRALATLAKVSAERVRDELLKLMTASLPSVGLRALQRVGALAEVLPEAAGWSADASRWASALACIDLHQARPAERLAGLFVDFGRGWPPTVEPAAARRCCRRLRCANRDTAAIAGMVDALGSTPGPAASPGELRGWVASVGRDVARSAGRMVAAAARLDALRCGFHGAVGSGSAGPLAGPALMQLSDAIDGICSSETALSVRELAINGRDLQRELGLPAGPALGRTLQTLLRAVLEDPSCNTPVVLYELARSALDGPHRSAEESVVGSATARESPPTGHANAGGGRQAEAWPPKGEQGDRGERAIANKPRGC